MSGAGAVLGGLGLMGGAVNAYGQLQESRAAAQAYNFNAQVAEQNAIIATQKRKWAIEQGDQDIAASQMKTAAKIGATKANQAASGVEVGTGSNADVIQSERELGMLDALTIRSNAARAAYGYETEAYSHKMQAQLDRYAAKNAKTAGKIGAIGTLIGSAARSTQYDNFMSKSSVFSPSFGNISPNASPSDAAVLGEL